MNKEQTDLLLRLFTSYDTNVKEVIYNPPATIVYFTDGTKTVVRCHKEDKYDRTKGLMYCIAKRFLGTENFHKVLKEFTDEYSDEHIYWRKVF